jgi:CHAT domain-containing protein
MQKIKNFILSAFFLLLLPSCATVSTNLMLNEEKLLHHGQYDLAISEIEKSGSVAEPNAILTRCKKMIREGKGADNFGLIFYTHRMKNMITALIETGRFQRAWHLSTLATKNIQEIDRLSRSSKKHRPSTTVLAQKMVYWMNSFQAYMIWFKTGDLNKWLEYYNKGVEQFTTAEPRDKMIQHLEIGLFHEKILGDFDQALFHYDQVLHYTDQLDILRIDEKFNYKMIAYRHLMLVNIKLGHLKIAEKRLLDYENMVKSNIYKTGRFLLKDQELFRGYLCFHEIIAGMIHSQQKDYATAENYFKKAWKILEKIPTGSNLIWDRRAIGAYHVIYGTYFLGSQNRIQEAAAQVEKGLRYLEPGYIEAIQSEFDIETAYLHAAELHFLNSDYTTAEARAKRAITLSDRYHNHTVSGRAWTLIGRIRMAQNAPREALTSLQTAGKIFGHIENTENWRLFYTQGEALEQTGNETNALRYYQKAVNEVEKLWDGRFDHALKQLSFMENRLVAFEPVIRLSVKNKEHEQVINYMERAKARTYFDTVQKMTRKSAPEIRSFKPFTTSQIQTGLPENTAVLEYYIGEKIVAGAFISRNKTIARQLPVDPETLQQLIYAFRKTINPNGTDLERGIRISPESPVQSEIDQTLTATGRKLEKCLIQPFADYLTKGLSLCIVPHGALHYLPFQALVLPDSQFMIQHHAVSYAPSSTVLFHARQWKITPPLTLLAAGSPPEFDISLSENKSMVLKKLPFAEMEMQQVGQLFKQKNLLSDQAATETAVKAGINQNNTLLFSTHGMLMRHNPLGSSLIFTPDSQNDGWLTVEEIEVLRPRADLVVLSACEAGLLVGREGMDTDLAKAVFPPGDDLFGLQKAFLSSGSKSVISTLWPVNDESTTQLITSFFNFQQKNGMNKAAALRAAQLHLMKSKKEWRHPFYWAPFILSGDWQ